MAQKSEWSDSPDDLVIYDPNYTFRPFRYIVEDFNGINHSIRGFFPSDVRHHCNFNVLKIKGPIVESFGSWVMHELVEIGNK